MTHPQAKRIAWYWLAVNIALGLFLLSCLTSCYGPKKAEKQARKALIKHPEVIAEIARTAFPCVEKTPDSTDYKAAIAQRDSVASAADSLGNWITYLRGRLDGLKLDSVTSLNCGDLLKQVEDYAKEVERKNNDLSRQIKNIKPARIKVPVEDSSKIFIAQRLQRSAEDTAAHYRTLYLKEKQENDERKAKDSGKILIRIPILLIIILALLGSYAFVSKLRNTFNPLNWFKK